jgi:hypothetical protein
MKAAVYVVLVFAMVAATASVGRANNNGYVETNNKSDAWVWVTARGYVKKAIGGAYENIAAYCVRPHNYFKRDDFKARVTSALFEVTRGPNCAHPLLQKGGINASGNNVRALIYNNFCPPGPPCVKYIIKQQ